MPYLLDTNVFIQAKNLYYGFDFCPGFWEWLDLGNKQNNVFSIEKVQDELIAGDDDLAQWAKNRDSQFFLTPVATMLPSLKELSSWANSGDYEQVAVNNFLQSADYYLIAQALTNDYVVVSHEIISNSTKNIKIPSVCINFGVKVMTPYEMLRTERARFVLDPYPSQSKSGSPL